MSNNYHLIDLSNPTRTNLKPFQTCSKLLSTRTSVFSFWKPPRGLTTGDLGAGIIESRSALEEEVYRGFVSAAVIIGYSILHSSLLQASFAFIYSPAWPLLCCCPPITVPRSMVSSFFSFSASPAPRFSRTARSGFDLLISSETDRGPGLDNGVSWPAHDDIEVRLCSFSRFLSCCV